MNEQNQSGNQNEKNIDLKKENVHTADIQEQNTKTETTGVEDATNSIDDMNFSESGVEEEIAMPFEKNKFMKFLGIAFIICVIILIAYSVMLSNNYNELVAKYNELKTLSDSCLNWAVK